MKHDRIDWTTQALANRSDSIARPGSVSDVMGGDDHRSVAVFYEHQPADFIDERHVCSVCPAAEVIGVVIGGDDPDFPADVLDREQARDTFGDDLVARWEAIETEKLQ